MKGWTKFLIVFVIVLAFVSVPVTFIFLNNNGNVYTREQAYALANKVCEDLEISGGVHSQAVSDYTEEAVSDELMNYVKGSSTFVLAIRKILEITDWSEDTYFKWVGKRKWGEGDELIDWDFYLFKYKLIAGGVACDFITISHSESDKPYKIVITLTEQTNGWEFDYYMTDYFINEVSNKNGMKSSFVYNIHANAENGKVYNCSYAAVTLSSKNMYKDGNIVVGDCSSFKYESVNTKTKKMETISSSETENANKIVRNLVDAAKKLYSVNFENVENPKIVREEEIIP